MAHPTGGEAPGRMTDWEPEVIKPFPEYNDRPTGPALLYGTTVGAEPARSIARQTSPVRSG